MSRLSIIIPARNEEFLQKTIEDINLNKTDDTEIIWEEDTKPIGQRALMNKLVKMSDSEYIMKADAHCSFAKGFDTQLLKDIEKDTLIIPAVMNLYAYDWICPQGHRQYQGAIKKCNQCESTELKKEIVWKPKKPVLSNHVFGRDFVPQFAEKQNMDSISESMCIQGSAFLVSRENYWKWNLCDESFGSWGRQGTEIGLKVWLNGGMVLATRNTYYAHLFRGLEEFPYERDMKQVAETELHIKKMLTGNFKRDLDWLLGHFNYPLDWAVDK